MRSIITVVIFTAISISAFAQPKPLPLYPDGIPNSKKAPQNYTEQNNGAVTNVTVPTITPYFPAKGIANGTAVIICPGGGYAGLAMTHEGAAIAQQFNKIGVTAFVLKYRLPSDAIMIDKSIGPLQDVQTAIVIVRKNAAKWGINPAKVGIIGFSAGGHLASTAGTHFNRPVIDNKDNISLRPDFMMLIYPVITFGPLTHTGSRDNLIGKTPTEAQVDLYSNEKQVSANTPPTFLVHAEDDTTVPVQNSLMFYDSLLKNKVKAEMHLYQAGGHGFGLSNTKSKQKWFAWATGWLDENGFLN